MTAEHEVLTEVERTNERVARAFNQCWSDRDCDRLLTLLADDVQYMVYEGGPVHIGHAAIAGAVRPFLAKYSRVEFKIVQMNVMGPVVSHERTEDYYGPDGTLDTRFHVVGLLVIKDGKIALWRDYSMPGAKQIVGPMVSKK